MTTGRTDRQAVKQPVGAVLVVGGGIAGMQASLDLAEQGFKVYLAEAKSAIGGKMAQLDKTFPTNDCAMCTISPRLVEVGRHANIEIMTDTEVLEVSGQAGDFTARLQHAPRYVDPLKCVACGDCVKVCPVQVTDRFNEGLVQRRAAYKLYPQATPNAFAIEKRGISPCRDACPAGQRAQGYIALIREGRWEDALRVIKMDNPFPGICGRICNHRCEDACNRGLVDEPVNIRALKRFVTDKVYAEPRQPLQPVEVTHPGQRVAVIGAGPCGLTAAQDIIRQGYAVTVFEAMPVAGGMLRLGVPEFRLPAEIIEREVADIIDLGVELRLNQRIDNLDDLFEQGYHAVLIAVGAHEGVRLPIPGANLQGVLVNTEFLRDLRLGAYAENGNEALVSGLGKEVLVLGGGNVAIDVARSARRLGCRVSMACLESRERMPAHAWEIEAAEAEGITIYNDRNFESILDDGSGRAAGVECTQVLSFSFDEVGRLAIEKRPDSSYVLPCDTVIFSVGQRAGLAFIPADAGVGVTQRRTIAINPNTFAATRQGVFAAGDSVSGTAFVIEAVHSGHQAAESILRYLRGAALECPPKPVLPVVKLGRQEIEERLARGEIQRSPRLPLPELAAESRLESFAEVVGGYDEASAMAEAGRCLACGVCSECMSCIFACGVQAIDHDMPPKVESVNVGAVILAPGYQIYQAERAQEFGFGRYANVINALQLERLLSASGPTLGVVKRPSDGAKPKRIAFLQCIGSRDQSHDYCSSVCCMYATKEAIIAKEHDPELDVHIFLMDVRAFSKGYWSYFERARGRYGVHYTRCRVSMLRENPATRGLIVEYMDEGGRRWTEEFDLVVLSVGMEQADATRELARRLGVEVDQHGFCRADLSAGGRFNPLETNRAGIYAAGAFRGPKDIPEAVVEGSGAAAAVATELGAARFSLTERLAYPPERELRNEEVRIGVFICHCGSNIGGYLDVPDVTAYAAGLADVALAEANLYTCSQDSIRHISQMIVEHGLNRVVVASCTPLTHAPLFQDSLRQAGLNPFLFEMANIRNQCSWVHSHEWAQATHKAKDLVRMAVRRAALLTPQPTFDVQVQHAALVVGGGAAGMTAALNLGEQGYPVHLVERQGELGGNLRRLATRLPDGGSDGAGIDPAWLVGRLAAQVEAHPMIQVYLNSQVTAVQGFMGNFVSTIEDADGRRTQAAHGIAILATGGQEYRGNDYGYGSHARILTQQEFEGVLAKLEPGVDAPRQVVMIQCVGPAEKYCSRICCTTALKNALRLKVKMPEAQITILHQDIRTYGGWERYYTEARRQGILFVRYNPERKPEVSVEDGEQGELTVRVWDETLRRTLTLGPDYLVLSMPVVPDADSHKLATLFKVQQDADGFFQEAHVKLRPVDFATEGVFMAGLAHYPKLVGESIVQAQAAAARAGRVLARETLTAGGRIAVVTDEQCTGCLTCVRICPYHVPVIKADLSGVGSLLGAAYIEPAVCQGCGICAAECPAHAIQLMHYTDAQMEAKVRALRMTNSFTYPAEQMIALMDAQEYSADE